MKYVTLAMLIMLSVPAVGKAQSKSGDETEQFTPCAVEKRFFLRGSIEGGGFNNCIGFDANNAASLTFGYDYEAGEDSGEIRMGLGYRPAIFDGLTSGGATLLIFADAEGPFDEAESNQLLKIGALVDVETYFGGQTPVQDGGVWSLHSSFSAAYLTDFGFDAKGHSLTARFTPVYDASEYGLNFLLTDGVYFMGDLGLEALWVAQAGATGLADDTSYAFAEMNLGIGYKSSSDAPVPLSATLNGLIGSELRAVRSYTQYEASVVVPIGSDFAGLKLSRTGGENRETGEAYSDTSMSISFRF